MHLYLAPWRFEPEPYPTWRSPFDDDAGSIDLRTPAQVRADGIAEGYGLFATRAPQSVADAIDLGDTLDGSIDRVTLRQALGLGENLVASTVRGAIYELLTMHADPAVKDRWGCLLPTRHRRCEVWLGGKIIARRLRPESDAEWPVIRARLQNDYREIKRRADDPKDSMPARQHRKYLATLQRKYGIADYDQFIPRDLPSETPVEPATTFTDDFNRANENLEVSANWTLYNWSGSDASFRVNSNRCEPDSTLPVVAWAQYASNLSTDDHYGQVEVVALVFGSESLSASARLHNSGTEARGYDARVFGNASSYGWSLQRQDNSAATGIGSVNFTPTLSLPDTIRCEADGSTIRGVWNGATWRSATDTTYSGQLRAGLSSRLKATVGDLAVDDFEAGDLVAGAARTPTLSLLGVG